MNMIFVTIITDTIMSSIAILATIHSIVVINITMPTTSTTNSITLTTMIIITAADIVVLDSVMLPRPGVSGG